MRTIGNERCHTERRKNMGENREGGVLRTTTLTERL
jgi:hypothetical protein